MRPIKYRCFNKKTNEITNDIFSINLAHNEVVVWKEIYDDGQSYINYEVLFGFKDEFELMQFTGLLDKNGKEIYEGDIVKFSWLRSEVIDVIEFAIIGIAAGFQLSKFGNYTPPSNDWKIIGNIHSNPELLETK